MVDKIEKRCIILINLLQRGGVMKPAWMAVVAMVIYAFQNVVMEQKFGSKYSIFPLLVYIYLAMLPLALGGWAYLRMTGQPVVQPSGSMIILTILVGLAYFIADSFYLGAYTGGGDVLTVTARVVMIPVLASAIKYFWTGGLPNLYQVIGYILAVAAVIMVAKGSSVGAGR